MKRIFLLSSAVALMVAAVSCGNNSCCNKKSGDADKAAVENCCEGNVECTEAAENCGGCEAAEDCGNCEKAAEDCCETAKDCGACENAAAQDCAGCESAQEPACSQK